MNRGDENGRGGGGDTTGGVETKKSCRADTFQSRMQKRKLALSMRMTPSETSAIRDQFVNRNTTTLL